MPWCPRWALVLSLHPPWRPTVGTRLSGQVSPLLCSWGRAVGLFPHASNFLFLFPYDKRRGCCFFFFFTSLFDPGPSPPPPRAPIRRIFWP